MRVGGAKLDPLAAARVEKQPERAHAQGCKRRLRDGDRLADFVNCMFLLTAQRGWRVIELERRTQQAVAPEIALARLGQRPGDDTGTGSCTRRCAMG